MGNQGSVARDVGSQGNTAMTYGHLSSACDVQAPSAGLTCRLSLRPHSIPDGEPHCNKGAKAWPGKPRGHGGTT